MKTTIEDLLTASEQDTRLIIINTLKHYKIPHTITPDYIVTRIKGTLPLICTHTDTVSLFPPHAKDLQREKGVISLKKTAFCQCLGADDRAGIWIALEMLQQFTRSGFNFAFFSGEESGCIGSGIFAKAENLDNYSCFIGLDRASRNGLQNVATYGYDNHELTGLFPYPEQLGSYTDCSTLSGHSDQACINLSIGYQCEHGPGETLTIALMEETLQLLLGIDIPANKIFSQEYQASSRNSSGYSADWMDEPEPICCDECGNHDLLYYTYEGGMLCADCVQFGDTALIKTGKKAARK